MAKAKKNKEYTEMELITEYMEYVLQSSPEENNVYHFCKSINMDETDFYLHFGSLRAMEKTIWEILMNNAITTVQKDSQYETYGPQEKLLSLLYTFFENLTLNRSYILKCLDNASITEQLDILKKLKKTYEGFILNTFGNIAFNGIGNLLNNFDQIKRGTIKTGFWSQLLFLIDFWRKDESKSFEKTDIAIEKCVLVAMDMMDTNPTRSILDLGKFFFRERVFK